MSVRVSVIILVTFGIIACVNAALPTLNTFSANGGFRICRDSNFRSRFNTICGMATGACGSIKIEFDDQTTSGNLLICRDNFNRPTGCAYATSKNSNDFSYEMLNYNSQGQSCY